MKPLLLRASVLFSRNKTMKHVAISNQAETFFSTLLIGWPTTSNPDKEALMTCTPIGIVPGLPPLKRIDAPPFGQGIFSTEYGSVPSVVPE